MQTYPSSNTTTASAPRTVAKPGRLVTDAPTRMFHWLFALSFVGAYLTADGEHWRLLHVTLGYTMAGLLLFRLLYGVFGPRQASLGLMWRKLAGALMKQKPACVVVSGGSSCRCACSCWCCLSTTRSISFPWSWGCARSMPCLRFPC